MRHDNLTSPPCPLCQSQQVQLCSDSNNPAKDYYRCRECKCTGPRALWEEAAHELDASDRLRERLGAILTGVANALKGEPDALSLHSWHDLEQVAREKMTQIDALLAHCPDPECLTCGAIICPHHEPLHFHHDGCPACYERKHDETDR